VQTKTTQRNIFASHNSAVKYCSVYNSGKFSSLHLQGNPNANPIPAVPAIAAPNFMCDCKLLFTRCCPSNKPDMEEYNFLVGITSDDLGSLDDILSECINRLVSQNKFSIAPRNNSKDARNLEWNRRWNREPLISLLADNFSMTQENFSSSIARFKDLITRLNIGEINLSSKKDTEARDAFNQNSNSIFNQNAGAKKPAKKDSANKQAKKAATKKVTAKKDTKKTTKSKTAAKKTTK